MIILHIRNYLINSVMCLSDDDIFLTTDFFNTISSNCINLNQIQKPGESK